jgi:hypothetical protein
MTSFGSWTGGDPCDRSTRSLRSCRESRVDDGLQALTRRKVRAVKPQFLSRGKASASTRYRSSCKAR